MAASKPEPTAAPKKLTTENFSFQRAKGAVLKTETGIFSSRHSKTDDGKPVPCDGWLLGDHFMVTEIDKERARKDAEARGDDVDEAEANAKPGQYLRMELASPTIVVQMGKTKVQEDGEVLCFVNTQLKRLLDYAHDKEYVHRWELMPTGESKVSGGKRTMHNYELTFVEKITRAEYIKRKGDTFAAATKSMTKNALPENGASAEA